MSRGELLTLAGWVVAFLGGGLAGATLTAIVSAYRQKTELAFKILEQYFARQQQIADALTILQAPAALKTVGSFNKVTAVGDWYETLALLCRRGIVNKALLRKAGVMKQMKRFLAECRKANGGGDLDGPLRAWTELDALTA